MKEIKFSISESGYNIDEVNQYIEIIQNEYRNAVEWGNSLEQQLNEIKSSDDNTEVDRLKEENKKLLGDCKALATKLNEMINTPKPETEKGTEGNLNIDILKNAAITADNIISNAKKNAEEITATALKNQEKLINSSIDKLLSTRKEIIEAEDEKNRILDEIEKIKESRDELSERIEKAKELLR